MFPLESCTKNHKKQLHWIPTALETVQLLSKIIEIQFGAAPHKKPWFIPSVPGGVTFIKIEAEQIPFVRELLIPNSEYVGYKHKLIASNWQQTYSQRLAKGWDPTLFVVADRSTVFDFPENRVFLYLIKQIFSLVSVRTTQTESNDMNLDKTVILNEHWKNRLDRMNILVSNMLKNPFVRNIGSLHHLTELLIEKVEKTRGQWYSKLAEISRTYLKCQDDPLQFLKEIVPQQVLVPLNPNTLYELAVLFRIIDVCQKKGWLEKRVGLIGGGKQITSQMMRDGNTLTVYFQGIPSIFTSESKYKNAMHNYGLSDKSRRPDIVLEYDVKGSNKYCIVEVKRSSNREYLADGFYKLLGYLKDFESIKIEYGYTIQGILVGWEGINRFLPAADEEVYMTGWPYLEDTLQVLL